MNFLADSLLSLIKIIAIPLLFVGSGWASYLLWTDSATWWNMRSYTQVQAHVTDAELREKKGSRSDEIYLRLIVSYTYSFGGKEFKGDDLGPGMSGSSDAVKTAVYRQLKAAPDGMVSVWVNPKRPQDAVLDRRFGWRWVGLMFIASVLAFIIAYCNMPNRSISELVGTTAGWFPKTVFALLWNIAAWPVLRVALIVREHPVVWILATLLVTVVGVILAFQALKECFAQRHPD
jgi:hypothetical protein